MKALVTGVAGFIGSHLAERLLGRECEVIGVDCFTDYYARSIKESNLAKANTHSGFRFIETTIQEADWSELLAGVTHVFHLAAQAGVRRSWGRDFAIYTACNIDATQVLLEACVGLDIERFVYSSSSSVYGDRAEIPMREDALPQPVSPYGVTKLAAEHLARLYHRNYGLATVSLRFFTVYGPRQRPDMATQRFLTAARDGTSIMLFGDGEQTRDFTFVADTVEAMVRAAELGREGAVYNVGGGSTVTVNELIEAIEEVSGCRLEVDRQGAQRGDVRDTCADTTRALADLDFAPTTSLREGLERQWQHVLASGIPDKQTT